MYRDLCQSSQGLGLHYEWVSAQFTGGQCSTSVTSACQKRIVKFFLTFSSLSLILLGAAVGSFAIRGDRHGCLSP